MFWVDVKFLANLGREVFRYVGDRCAFIFGNFGRDDKVFDDFKIADTIATVESCVVVNHRSIETVASRCSCCRGLADCSGSISTICSVPSGSHSLPTVFKCYTWYYGARTPSLKQTSLPNMSISEQ